MLKVFVLLSLAFLGTSGDASKITPGTATPRLATTAQHDPGTPLQCQNAPLISFLGSETVVLNPCTVPDSNDSEFSRNDSGGDSGAPSDGLGDQTSSTQPECYWQDINEPPDSLRWGGFTPSEGYVAALFCGAALDDGSGAGGPVDFQFFANPVGGQTAPPPPNPAAIAQQAIELLNIPKPLIGAGPDRARLAVNLWTWLWVGDPGPLTQTAEAGGVSVTATASLSSVTWSLGEPAATGGPYADGPPVTLTCQGTGTPPPANYDWKTEPPCGHMYTWRSTTDRTNGTGTWPITATSNWSVTWQSNTGVTGSTTLSATSNDALEIGEYRTVLVEGPGG